MPSGDSSYREMRATEQYTDQPAVTNGDSEETAVSTVEEMQPLSKNKSTYELSLEQELDEDLTGQSHLKIEALGGDWFWGTEVDLDENAYGAAAVAIVKDVSKLHHEIKTKAPWQALSLNLTRLCSALGIMGINLLFQGLILMYINIYVVQPSVHHVQALYANFHADNYDENGNFNEEVWATYEHKDDVCQITMSSRAFYFGILMLWGLLMMMELRACERVVRDILAVRPVKHLEHMVEYTKTGNSELGGRCLIVGLTRGMRWAVLLMVCLPRIIIAVYLFALGCRWLSSSASFADMTLNAMALEFVKDIDELLYNAVLPRQLKKDIADTNVFKIEKRKTKADLDKEEWSGYVRTTFWVIIIIAFLGTYGAIFQSVLPFDLSELSLRCAEQNELTRTAVCNDFTWQGWSEECYPYGKLITGLTGWHHHHAASAGHAHALAAAHDR